MNISSIELLKRRLLLLWYVVSYNWNDLRHIASSSSFFLSKLVLSRLFGVDHYFPKTPLDSISHIFHAHTSIPHITLNHIHPYFLFSYVITCPNHISLFSLNFSTIDTTLMLLFTYSFLILSFLVSSPLEKRVFVFVYVFNRPMIASKLFNINWVFLLY